MKRALASVGTLLLLALSASTLHAQECKTLLCAPSFSAQPGIVIFNAFNAPTINAAGDRAASSTEFLVRLATVAPSRIPRTSLVAVVWWTPFFTQTVTNAAGNRVELNNNAPNFLVGPSFLLLRQGPVVAQLAVVDGYRRWERVTANGDIDSYRHNLVLAPSVNLRLGSMLPATAPALARSVAAYGIWQQQVTNMPYNIGRDGRPDGSRAYPPGLFFGITVPIAPTP